MGIYDRDYSRDEPQGITLGGERSMVTNLILINVGIYLIDYLFLKKADGGFWLRDLMHLEPGLFREHYKVWQLLTYGFVHIQAPLHVAFNMLGLWFFGREVESTYGRQTFLALYLTLIIMSGVVTSVVQQIVMPDSQSTVVGASGAVVGILMIFICHDPRRTILIWGFIPCPAWVLGSLYILQDVASFAQLGRNPTGDRTAVETHLAGAAFGYLFYRTQWTLASLIPGRLSLRSFKPRPKLRIHEEDAEPRDLSERVDEILEKISAKGEASLTAEERRTLQEAAKRYQRRRR